MLTGYALCGGITRVAGAVPPVNTGRSSGASLDCHRHLYQRHVDLFDGLSMRRIAITPRLSTDSLHVARNTVLTGLGVAVVSSWTVKEDIREGRLFICCQNGGASAYYPSIWCIRGPDITRHAYRRFLEMMKQVMPDIAGMKARQRAIKKPTRRSAFYIMSIYSADCGQVAGAVARCVAL